MRPITFVTLCALAAVSQASLIPRAGIHFLRQTQSPASSSACDSTCGPFQSTLNTCANMTCLCTASVAGSLQACIDCAVTSSPVSSVIAAAQTLRDQFQSSCSTFGIPPITLPAAAGATATGGAPGGSTSTPANALAGPVTAPGSGFTSVGFLDANPTSQSTARPSSSTAGATVSAAAQASKKTSGASRGVYAGRGVVAVAVVAASLVLCL